MLQQMETKYQRSLRRFQSLVPHGWRLPNVDWNSAAALEYLGPAAFNKNQQKQIQVVFANAATVYPGSFFNPFTWYIRVRCDDPFKRCDRCNPPENPPPPKRRTKLSDRAKHLALRSEEHTSELQSPCNLVCRLLLEKKNQQTYT